MKNYLNLTEWQTNLELSPWAVPQAKALILKAVAALQPQGTGCVTQPSFLRPSPYPILQFQTRHYRGAQYLYLLGLEPALKKWVRLLDGQKIRWMDSLHPLGILREQHRAFRLRSTTDAYAYQLYNYTPLRTADYQQFCALPDEPMRARCLTHLLGEHIQSYFQQALGRRLSFDLSDLKIRREKSLRTQGCSLRAFDLEFQTTAFLPEYIGLGPGAARGLGTLRRPRREQVSKPDRHPKRTKTTQFNEKLLPDSGHTRKRRPRIGKKSVPAKSLPVSS